MFVGGLAHNVNVTVNLHHFLAALPAQQLSQKQASNPTAKQTPCASDFRNISINIFLKLFYTLKALFETD